MRKMFSERPSRAQRAIAMALLASTMISAGPEVSADSWPSGGGPSLGGAVAARAIGDACPHLFTDRETDVLDSYIERRRSEIAALSLDDAASVNAFMPALEDQYARRDRCTDDDEDMAKDMLQRIEDSVDVED